MRKALVCVSMLAAVALPAAAVPILNPANGHHYELIIVANPFTGVNNHWATASAAAAASIFMGENGHLATVTSQAENDFLFSLVAPPPSSTSPFAGAWLGGNATNWLVGPEAPGLLTYQNFGGDEPNNAGLVYMNIGGLFAGIGSGEWVDDSGVQGEPTPGNDPVIGYFVEYETPLVTQAPAPASGALLAIGLLGLYGLRRRAAVLARR